MSLIKDMAKTQGGLLAATVGLLITATPVSAEEGPGWEYPSAVATFQRICLVPGLDPKDRIAALEADQNWREDQTVSVDVPQMGISKTIDKNYAFPRSATPRQWSGEMDGRKVRLVVATFNEKVRYPNLCALILDGPRSAMPYAADLRAAFKSYGIGGKSVDLVHYFEFAGKVGPDKHPVRGEIFSRSLSGRSKQTTHIYFAY